MTKYITPEESIFSSLFQKLYFRIKLTKQIALKMQMHVHIWMYCSKQRGTNKLVVFRWDFFTCHRVWLRYFVLL